MLLTEKIKEVKHIIYYNLCNVIDCIKQLNTPDLHVNSLADAHLIIGWLHNGLHLHGKLE